MKPSARACRDCGSELSRRDFLRASTALGASMVLAPASLRAEARATPSETLAATLHRSLTEEQRKVVCFPFDHPLRSKVDNNWQITPKSVAEFFQPDQQQMVREIFMSLHSPEYAQTVYNQVVHDSGQEGFGGCSVALFGEPGSGQFEFVLTGRHCTRRCDGDAVAGAAFGGPIFYGHAAKGFYEKADHPGNAYWYQAVQANEVFKMLDGKQRQAALLGTAREEQGTETVKLTGKKAGLPGLPVSDLSRDQQEQFRKTLAALLAPFRKTDADEALWLIEASGLDHLHMAFFKNHDVGSDGVWDVWQIEGPAALFYFRGDPHVHAWAHIRREA